VEDETILQESVLPPLLEFDTLYYYNVEHENDESIMRGEIPIEYVNCYAYSLRSVSRIEVKDMSKSKEAGHAFIVRF
jgi:hypothetical protein